MFKRLLTIISLAYIYQLAKFGDFMSWGSKYVFKNVPCLMYDTHRDVRDSANHGMVKNTKNLSILKTEHKFLICASDDTYWKAIVLKRVALKNNPNKSKVVYFFQGTCFRFHLIAVLICYLYFVIHCRVKYIETLWWVFRLAKFAAGDLKLGKKWGLGCARIIMASAMVRWGVFNFQYMLHY